MCEIVRGNKDSYVEMTEMKNKKRGKDSSYGRKDQNGFSQVDISSGCGGQVDEGGEYLSD